MALYFGILIFSPVLSLCICKNSTLTFLTILDTSFPFNTPLSFSFWLFLRTLSWPAQCCFLGPLPSSPPGHRDLLCLSSLYKTQFRHQILNKVTTSQHSTPPTNQLNFPLPACIWALQPVSISVIY